MDNLIKTDDVVERLPYARPELVTIGSSSAEVPKSYNATETTPGATPYGPS